MTTTLDYTSVLRALVAATAPVAVAPVAPTCSCWACRQASNDLAPIPAAIAEAVEGLEGWGNEPDGEGQYCADCRAEWDAKYGDNDD